MSRTPTSLNISRRIAVLGLPAMATAGTIPSAAGASLQSPLTIRPPVSITDGAVASLGSTCTEESTCLGQVRSLVDRTVTAIYEEVDSEEFGTRHPLHVAARWRARKLECELDAVSEAVWASPPRTWDDVLRRANILRRWSEIDREGKLLPPTTSDVTERAVYELLGSVLAVGGRNA